MGERTWNWLRDLFGINRYAVAWDFEWNGSRLTGRYPGRLYQNGMNKRVASNIANSMNRDYNTDGHWVEPLARPTHGPLA